MDGRIKFVFATGEDMARQSLTKRSRRYNNDSFSKSEYVRPTQALSVMSEASVFNANCSMGPELNRMNPSNMMGVMFEAFLQNQIEYVFKRQQMSGTSMLNIGE